MQKMSIKTGTWDGVRALIGQIFARSVGADPVSRADVRRKLEVLRFDSPLNTDDALARSLGYRAAPALTTMLLTWSVPAYWAPADGEPEAEPLYVLPAPITTIPAPGDSLFGTDFRTEYFEPVYPGDVITAEVKLIDVVEKETKVGPGGFITAEVTYLNQDGIVCGIERMTMLRYQAKSGTDGDH